MSIKIGDVIYCWTIIGPFSFKMRGTKNRKYTVSQCVCGKKRIHAVDHLQSNRTKSCGCKRKNRLTHGLAGTPEYIAWIGMKARCYYPKTIRFERWGGRGIKVCRQWIHSFETFLSDMGHKPKGKYCLERRNNNGNYTKKNCYWATPTEQARNTKRTRLIKHGGVILTAGEWSKKIGIKRTTIIARIIHGWSIKEALNTKVFRRQ